MMLAPLPHFPLCPPRSLGWRKQARQLGPRRPVGLRLRWPPLPLTAQSVARRCVRCVPLSMPRLHRCQREPLGQRCPFSAPSSTSVALCMGGHWAWRPVTCVAVDDSKLIARERHWPPGLAWPQSVGGRLRERATMQQLPPGPPSSSERRGASDTAREVVNASPLLCGHDQGADTGVHGDAGARLCGRGPRVGRGASAAAYRWAQLALRIGPLPPRSATTAQSPDTAVRSKAMAGPQRETARGEESRAEGRPLLVLPSTLPLDERSAPPLCTRTPHIRCSPFVIHLVHLPTPLPHP